MFNAERINQLSQTETPFYFYDLALLQRTLDELTKEKGNYHVHYALKANAHFQILKLIKQAGVGADCVSGNEIKRALECGFTGNHIAFAGVGKTDKEIRTALDADIFSFNVESLPELQVINEIAAAMGKTARIALRINPNIDAHTHKYITTGLEENKFGINPYEFDNVLAQLSTMQNVSLKGIHFHIGSQIQDMSSYRQLCGRINELYRWFVQRGFELEHINAGGGLGINYLEPDQAAIVDFKSFFGIFRQFLDLPKHVEVHFELGRSLVGQCGSLISSVVFVKDAINTSFVILDAGMTELIRPALYQAYHKIENISNPNGSVRKYDVVGPICESSDCFGKAVVMTETKRGDLVAIRSAGAYGEVMSSRYNLREETRSVFGD